MCDYINGYVTDGCYFTFNGVKYGRYTQVLFKEDFYKRVGEYVTNSSGWAHLCGYKFPYFRALRSIKNVDGKLVWGFGSHKFYFMTTHRYTNIIPERDIERIIIPVYYMTPKELAKKRLREGNWFKYIGFDLICYLCILPVSLIFNDWLTLWIFATGVFIYKAYKELSKGELNSGW